MAQDEKNNQEVNVVIQDHGYAKPSTSIERTYKELTLYETKLVRTASVTMKQRMCVHASGAKLYVLIADAEGPIDRRHYVEPVSFLHLVLIIFDEMVLRDASRALKENCTVCAWEKENDDIYPSQAHACSDFAEREIQLDLSAKLIHYRDLVDSVKIAMRRLGRFKSAGSIVEPFCKLVIKFAGDIPDVKRPNEVPYYITEFIRKHCIS